MADEATRNAQPAPSSERLLSDEILAESERKAGRIRKRAEREGRQIVMRAKQRAAEATAKTLEVAEERAQRLEDGIMATFDTEVQRDRLAARERALDGLFDTARARLADRASYDYPAVLAALAAQAITAMGVGEVVLELAEADLGIATVEWLEGVWGQVEGDVTLDVSDTPAPIDGGLIVRSADGRLLYDNSFAARLERLKPELRRELAATLFEEDERPDTQ